MEELRYIQNQENNNIDSLQDWVDKLAGFNSQVSQSDIIKWANSIPVKPIKEMNSAPLYLYGDVTIDKAITNLIQGEELEPNVATIYGALKNNFMMNDTEVDENRPVANNIAGINDWNIAINEKARQIQTLQQIKSGTKVPNIVSKTATRPEQRRSGEIKSGGVMRANLSRNFNTGVNILQNNQELINAGYEFIPYDQEHLLVTNELCDYIVNLPSLETGIIEVMNTNGDSVKFASIDDFINEAIGQCSANYSRRNYDELSASEDSRMDTDMNSDYVSGGEEGQLVSFKLNQIAHVMNLFANDLLYIHHHAIGNDFDSVHEVMQKLYEKATEDVDALAEMALRFDEKVGNLALSATVVSPDVYKVIDGGNFTKESMIPVIQQQGNNLLDVLRSYKEDYPADVKSALDDMANEWESEINYKNKARGKTFSRSHFAKGKGNGNKNNNNKPQTNDNKKKDKIKSPYSDVYGNPLNKEQKSDLQTIQIELEQRIDDYRQNNSKLEGNNTANQEVLRYLGTLPTNSSQFYQDWGNLLAATPSSLNNDEEERLRGYETLRDWYETSTNTTVSDITDCPFSSVATLTRILNGYIRDNERSISENNDFIKQLTKDRDELNHAIQLPFNEDTADLLARIKAESKIRKDIAENRAKISDPNDPDVLGSQYWETKKQLLNDENSYNQAKASSEVSNEWQDIAYRKAQQELAVKNRLAVDETDSESEQADTLRNQYKVKQDLATDRYRRQLLNNDEEWKQIQRDESTKRRREAEIYRQQRSDNDYQSYLRQKRNQEKSIEAVDSFKETLLSGLVDSFMGELPDTNAVDIYDKAIGNKLIDKHPFLDNIGYNTTKFLAKNKPLIGDIAKSGLKAGMYTLGGRSRNFARKNYNAISNMLIEVSDNLMKLGFPVESLTSVIDGSMFSGMPSDSLSVDNLTHQALLILCQDVTSAERLFSKYLSFREKRANFANENYSEIEVNNMGLEDPIRLQYSMNNPRYDYKEN